MSMEQLEMQRAAVAREMEKAADAVAAKGGSVGVLKTSPWWAERKMLLAYYDARLS